VNEYLRNLLESLTKRKTQLEERVRTTRKSQESGSSGPIIKHKPAQQARHVASLIAVMRRTKWTKFDKELCILSARWFEKWSNYVRFDKYFNASKGQLKLYYFNSHDANEADSTHEPPGPIDNQTLLMESKEYYHNLCHPNATCNHILRESLEENRDYYVVTREIWEYLCGIYDGTKVHRHNIFIGPNGKMYPDIKLERVFLGT